MASELLIMEPNPKVLSELSDNLKEKYLLHNKRAECLLETFYDDLKGILKKQKDLLEYNTELLIENEKLKDIRNGMYNWSNQNKVSTSKEKNISRYQNSHSFRSNSHSNSDKDSDDLKSNTSKEPNTSLYKNSHSSNSNSDKENKDSEELAKDFELINIPEISTQDFESEMEIEIIHKPLHSSPIQENEIDEIVNSSPVISKDKKKRGRKNCSLNLNNSSHSSTSNTSKTSVDSKNSYKPKVVKNLEEMTIVNSNAISNHENKAKKTPEKLKTFRNLGIAKNIFASIDYDKNGKKIKQSTLQFSITGPKIDIGKYNEYMKRKSQNINETHSNVNENIHKNKIPKKAMKENLESNEECNFDWVNLSIDQKKESKNKSKLRQKLLSRHSKNISPESFSTNDSQQYPVLGKPQILEEKAPNISKESSVDNTDNNETSNKAVDYVDIDETYFFTEKPDKINFECNEEDTKRDSSRSKSCIKTIPKINLAENGSDSITDLDDWENNLQPKSPPFKKQLLNSYDVIPHRTQENPEYACKEKPVRKKNERAQLNGFDCYECAGWYDIMSLTDEERKKMLKLCSRHRGKFKEFPSTPESFWNPVFSGSSGDEE